MKVRAEDKIEHVFRVVRELRRRPAKAAARRLGISTRRVQQIRKQVIRIE